MTLAILKKWVSDTLKNDVNFSSTVLTLLGKQLNYYRSAPINDVVETLPFLSVYGDSFERDDLQSNDWNDIFTIPIAIAITSNENSINDNGVIVWNSADIIENIAIDVIKLLKQESIAMGIQGESVNMLKSTYNISEIGEADDIQVSMLLTFGKLNQI